MRWGRLIAAGATVLLLVACGGSDKSKTAASGSAASTGNAVVASGTDTSLPDAGATDTTAAGGSGTGADQSAGAGDQSSDAGGGGDQGGNTDAPVPPGLKPFTGTYQYHVVGDGSLNNSPQHIDTQSPTVIEDISETDQRITQSGGQTGDQITVVRYTGTQIQLVSLQLTAINKTFQGPQPVEYIPLNAAVGTTWQWTIDSTDHLTHLKQSSRLDRDEQVTVNGQTVDTFVVETDITLTGDVNATGHLTSWGSTLYKVVVQAHSTISGTYAAFSFSGDTMATLNDLRPT
jgi:hypothetical protein